jgi:hypothetical protein
LSSKSQVTDVLPGHGSQVKVAASPWFGGFGVR